jgi:hypothetical protein
MKRLLPVIFVPALALIAFASIPTPSNAAPALSLSTEEKSILVGKPFSITLTISWEGDAETYLVETPRLKLPEGITQSGSAYSTSATDTTHSLFYRYTLSAAATGDYALDPVEISYWEKNAGDARIARTEELRFTVGSRSEAMLQRYLIPGAVLLIFISLFATLFVLSTKKKRAKNPAPGDSAIIKTIIDRELAQCRAYKISGDWNNYIKLVIAIRNKIPSAGPDEKIFSGLHRLAERVQFGGYRPSEDELALIDRQLEKACADAFPGEEIKT